MAQTIQLRRDTAAQWTTHNPVLANGEMGIETDTFKYKFGDGVTAWNTLVYFGFNGVYEDEANTFTAPQRTSISAEDNIIDFTTNNNFTLNATAAVMGTPTVTGCVGQSGTIVISTAENITGWDALYKFKTTPTGLTGEEVFAYFIENLTTIRIGVLA